MTEVIRIVEPVRWEYGLTGLKSLKQNINVICTTPKGSVPLDREFGINSSVIDLPYEAAMAMLRVEILDAVETYEPGATITEITFEKTEEDAAYFGSIIPVIKFIEKEE